MKTNIASLLAIFTIALMRAVVYEGLSGVHVSDNREDYKWGHGVNDLRRSCRFLTDVYNKKLK